jgi:hypothetical protein
MDYGVGAVGTFKPDVYLLFNLKPCICNFKGAQESIPPAYLYPGGIDYWAP